MTEQDVRLFCNVARYSAFLQLPIAGGAAYLTRGNPVLMSAWLAAQAAVFHVAIKVAERRGYQMIRDAAPPKTPTPS